jgi:hypothetical protein
VKEQLTVLLGELVVDSMPLLQPEFLALCVLLKPLSLRCFH